MASATAAPGAAPTVIIGTRVLCNYLHFDFRVSPVSEKLEHSKGHCICVVGRQIPTINSVDITRIFLTDMPKLC